ncbi:MAG: hypothetical protein K2H48_06035 [Duncaniella sp.]|nr:hypothetical protein [Duncaniella sp.]
MIPQNYRYNDGSATDNKIKLIIPILIKWARESWNSPHYYSDIARAIGSNPQSVGAWLGLIWSHVIHPRFPYAPSLNALVCNQITHLPSDGLDYVFPKYSKSSWVEQKAFVAKANLAAHEYDWNPVLRELGLKQLDVLPLTELIDYNNRVCFGKRLKKGEKGGESLFHKRLKQYIQDHPEKVGIIDEITFSNIEHTILSQDRIDILLATKDTTFAIEVKSEISNDDDIVRGVFQAVKYKAVLEAQCKINGNTNDVKSILVICRDLPELAGKMAKILDVTVIENFVID